MKKNISQTKPTFTLLETIEYLAHSAKGDSAKGKTVVCRYLDNIEGILSELRRRYPKEASR